MLPISLGVPQSQADLKTWLHLQGRSLQTWIYLCIMESLKMVGGNRAKDREKYSVAAHTGPVSFACLTYEDEMV